MYTASSILHKAMTYYIPSGRPKQKNIPKADRPKKSKRRRCNDNRRYYRTEYLKSEHWRSLRASKLRESPVCEKCGTNNHLDVHHVNYNNLYDVRLSDLKTLCRRCHHELHKNEEPRKHEKKGNGLPKKGKEFMGTNGYPSNVKRRPGWEKMSPYLHSGMYARSKIYSDHYKFSP
jgi:hypothetical protein